MGPLQYLNFMRLDICFVINIVYQFMHAPTDSHWAALKCILHYFQCMATYGLHITCISSFALHGFTDVD